MLLPLLMQLGMLARDMHDGSHELGDPYKKVEKKQESVRQTLDRIIYPPKPVEVRKPVETQKPVEVLIAKSIEGAHGVLGGDLRNMEIAMLMERARLMDEEEAIIMLMVH